MTISCAWGVWYVWYMYMLIIINCLQSEVLPSLQEILSERKMDMHGKWVGDMSQKFDSMNMLNNLWNRHSFNSTSCTFLAFYY